MLADAPTRRSQRRSRRQGGGAHRGGDDFDAATTHDEPAPGGSTGPEISDEDIPF